MAIFVDTTLDVETFNGKGQSDRSNGGKKQTGRSFFQMLLWRTRSVSMDISKRVPEKSAGRLSIGLWRRISYNPLILLAKGL